jgi:hypothetical protein
MTPYSELEFRNILILVSTSSHRLRREYTLRLKITESQRTELALYVASLSPEMILFGLRFAYNRQSAIAGGYLMPGRKSLVKRETNLLSMEQAKWRLRNWKTMIKSYREKGYSYPTISRIKKEIKRIAYH